MLTAYDRAFLESQRVARLGTLDGKGEQALVPVCFVLTGERVYVAIDAKPKRGNPRELKRLRNIREQPAVTLLADRYDENWSRLRWLMIRATASILETGVERERALDALEARYPQYAAMRLSALGLPVIALEPSTLSRWSASTG